MPIPPLLVPRSLPGGTGASFLDVPPSPRSGPHRLSTNQWRETFGRNVCFFVVGELGREPSRGLRLVGDRF